MILGWWGLDWAFSFYSILLYILFSFLALTILHLYDGFSFVLAFSFFYLLLLGFREGFGFFFFLIIIRTGILLFLHILHKTTLYFTFFFCLITITTSSTFTTNYFI
ncbi:hypothetical protein DFP73DRAFT_537056, partial [Morchella snyderi]